MKGFSLIESIIAISILATGIFGAIQAFPLGIQMVKSGQFATIAAYLAQAKIEGEISLPYNELSAGVIIEDYNEIYDFNAYKRITEIRCVAASDLSIKNCDYDLINDPYPMKKIEVTVFWRSFLGIVEKNINLATIVVKR